MIEEQGKGCILLFNKWDLVKGFRMEHCLKGIEEEVPFLQHCPKIFMSATTGRNVDKIFGLAAQVYADGQKRITTGQLNKFVAGCLQRNHPPMIGGKRLRIYYMAQVGIQPPKFVLFVNFPNLMTDSYKKYLYNQFREAYQFTGLPIEIYLRGKQKAKGKRYGPDDGGLEDYKEGDAEAEMDAEMDVETPAEAIHDDDFEDFDDIDDGIVHEGYDQD
jgi:GTP-binding protein